MKTDVYLPASEKVWDLFVRCFHWTMVSCILLDYFVISDGELLHQILGYAATALVLSRIVWGFIGTETARFRDFFPTPSKLMRHFKAIRNGEHLYYKGHNPLGALMILTLLTLIMSVGVSGWMQTLDAFWGEEWLMESHEILSHTLMAMVFIHVSAAIIMGKIERVKLVKAMVTGNKERY